MEHNEESSRILANGNSVVTLNFSNYTFYVLFLSLQGYSGFLWQKHHVYNPVKGFERGPVSAGWMNEKFKWKSGLQPLKSMKQFPV